MVTKIKLTSQAPRALGPRRWAPGLGPWALGPGPRSLRPWLGSALYHGQVDFTVAKWTLLWPRTGQVDFTMAEPAPESQTILKNRLRSAGTFCSALKGPITPKNCFS